MPPFFGSRRAVLLPAAIAVGLGPPLSAGLAMTQLTAGRPYQRTTTTGGDAGKGAGSIVVPITLTAAASSIEYRLRDADATGTTIKDWTSAGTNVPANATSVTCANVPANAKRYLLDLRANGDNAQIVLGTSPVMMGRNGLLWGQSQPVRQLAKASGYAGTLASLNVSVSPYCGVYATWGDSSVPGGGTAAWGLPSDAGPYTSTFAAEILRRQVEIHGVACGLIGHAVGDTAIAAWLPGTTNNVNLRAIIDAAGGFEWVHGHIGGNDAGSGTSKATIKSGLDAIYSDITAHNAARGANYTKILTAMATRTAGGAGTTATVTAVRQAHKEWCAANSGIYLEPHDIVLEDSVHQGQPGNIVLAQHVHRALATTDAGPTFGTPTLSTDNLTLYTPVNLPTGATALVLTGNAKSRLSVFPTGTQANPLTISSLTYDGTNKRLVAALSAAPTTNVDVYAFLHPDPSGTAANADMIRDDRTDGDGISVGRSLEPSTTGPVTAALNAVSTAPSNTAAPTITGTPQVGQTLTAAQGSWTNSPTNYAYQWNRAGTAISGATSSTYVPVSADIGNTLTVTVTATNANGSASATSAATAAVTAAASSGTAVGDVFLLNTYFQGSNGSAATTETGWNNIDQNTAKSGSPTTLKNSAGGSSPLSAFITNTTNVGNKQDIGTDVVPFPKSVVDTFCYADKGNINGGGVSSLIKLTITGVPDGTKWKFEVYGYRNNVINPPTRLQSMTIGATTISSSVGTDNKANITATFIDVVPVNGIIELSITQGSNENYAYLNDGRLTRTA